MHSRNRIGMHREGQVLMDTDIVPPNAQCVFVARLIRTGARFAFQAPAIVLMVQPDRGHQLLLAGLVNFPAAHVMTTGDDARLDSFGHPRAYHEISNLSLDANQIACAYTEPAGMTGMKPERIRVSDF